MKADWDDGPIHLHKREKNIPFIAALVTVTGLFLLGAYVTNVIPAVVKNVGAGSDRVTKTDSIRPSASMGDNPYRPIVEAVEDPYLDKVNQMLGITANSTSEPLAKIEWAEPEKNQQSEAQQTVFNDANYSQPGNVNTIRMPQSQPQSTQPQQRQKPYVTVVKETRDNCAFSKPGSLQCRKTRSQIYKNHSRACLRSGDSQSISCRLAKSYEPTR